MANEERTGQRSLVFSEWHREAFPDDWLMIDIDGAAFCRQPPGMCKSPLYVVEASMETIRTKPTSLTSQTAMRLNCVGLFVQHDETSVVEGWVVWPAKWHIGDRIEVEAYIQSLVYQHDRLWHGL